MYPVMLPGENSGLRFIDDLSRREGPDGLLREWYGTPPDPLGRLFLRVLDAIEARLTSLRSRSTRPSYRRQPSHPYV